jgi:hypothetical protein
MNELEVLLMVLLGTDRWGEAGLWIRESDGHARFGVEAAAFCQPEVGARFALTATLSSPDCDWFALTPFAGLSRFRDPWPEGGTELNFTMGLRAELRLPDGRSALLIEGRHTSNGRTVLRHDDGNPGSDALLVGLGVRF